MIDQNPSLNLAACPRASYYLFLLAGWLALVTPLRADNPPPYLFQWGGVGSGNGQFDYPYGIVADRSNNVYVTDTDNHRIEKFDSNGNYLTQWGSYGTNNGQFYWPNGIAVDTIDQRRVG